MLSRALAKPHYKENGGASEFLCCPGAVYQYCIKQGSRWRGLGFFVVVISRVWGDLCGNTSQSVKIRFLSAEVATKKACRPAMGSDQIRSFAPWCLQTKNPGWSSLTMERDCDNFFLTGSFGETILSLLSGRFLSSGDFHLSPNSHVSKARCSEHELWFLPTSPLLSV